jgi:hypothetical protein
VAVASVGLALAGILGGRLEAQASPLRPRAEDNTFPCLGRRLPLQVDGSPFLAAYPPPSRRHLSILAWRPPIFLLQRYRTKGQPLETRYDNTIKSGASTSTGARPGPGLEAVTRLISCLLNGQAGFLDHLLFADG